MALTLRRVAFPCANWERGNLGQACPQKGTIACAACSLVLYCSEECQGAHWTTHRLDCEDQLRKSSWKPAWELERRRPTFATVSRSFKPMPYGGRRYLWGNVPAIDLLQLADNETSDRAGDLHLLLAASGDLRNFIKTIVCLPADYQGHLEFDINDWDKVVVARNFLIMLIALHFPPEIASEMIIHLWYSAFLTESMVESIKNTILPVVTSILSSRKASPQGSLRATRVFSTTKLGAEFDRETWKLVLAFCDGKKTRSFEQASSLRNSVVLADSRQDFKDRVLFSLPPSWRLSKLKFCKDGVLLPFGSSCEQFTVPNRTFFEDTSWPLRDSADPLLGWDLSEILREPYEGKADLYGLLHLHVQRHLRAFCTRLSTLRMDVSFFCMDAVNLPSRISEAWKGKRLYDRIELANISDLSYLGPVQTIRLFGPLLQPKNQNPKATLLMLFINAAHDMLSSKPECRPSVINTIKQLKPFLPFNPDDILSGNSQYSAELVDCIKAQTYLFDMDGLFEAFVKKFQLEELAETLQLEMKPKHTIVAKWPLRLPRSPTQREFDMLSWSEHLGTERYVEWCRG